MLIMKGDGDRMGPIRLSGVPETMLQTLYARAKERRGRGAVHDPEAEKIVDGLDYDFSSAFPPRTGTPRCGTESSTLPADWMPGVAGCGATATGMTSTCPEVIAVRAVSNKIVILERV